MIGETITIALDDEGSVAKAHAAYDPRDGALYLPPGSAALAEGGLVTLRSQLYRVIGPPEVWLDPFTGLSAGLVAKVAPHASTAALPDTGRLDRPLGTVWDREANAYVPDWDEVWLGPCLVEVPTTQGSEAEAGEQRITVQPFTVQAPLDLVDIRPGDRLTILSSADARLVERPLLVTRVKAGSLATTRSFTVVDDQG